MLSMWLTLFTCFFLAAERPHATSGELATIEALVASGRLAEAQEAVSAALRSRPSDAGLSNVAGIIAAQEGERARAETLFLKAVQLNPRLKAAWLNLGRLYRSMGETAADVDKGIQVYRTVLKLQPDNAEANHELALLLHWKGNFRDSLSHLNRLPADDQGKRAALILRCADEAALGDTETALVLAQRILGDAEVQEADVVPILPVLHAHNGKVERNILEGLENSGRGGVETQQRLATIYENEGQLPTARQVYEKLAQSDPASVDGLLNLARVAWKQKDYEGTLGYLAHARDLAPGNAAIHFFMGVTCNEMRLPVEARKSLENAVELAPDNPYYNYAMGAIRLQWTDASAAVPYLKKYIAARPEDARGKLALAMAHFRAGNFDAAKAQAALLTSNAQVQVGAEFLLGRMAQNDGETEEGIAHFQRVLILDPKASEARSELASLLFERGDLERSRKETEAALSADPNNYTANATLLHLYQRDHDPRTQQQLTRLQSLIKERENTMRLLERTIEVRPF